MDYGVSGKPVFYELMTLCRLYYGMKSLKKKTGEFQKPDTTSAANGITKIPATRSTKMIFSIIMHMQRYKIKGQFGIINYNTFFLELNTKRYVLNSRDWYMITTFISFLRLSWQKRNNTLQSARLSGARARTHVRKRLVQTMDDSTWINKSALRLLDTSI